MVSSLLRKCDTTTKKLRAALADNSGGLSIKKPKMMSEHLTLKPYQRRGLYWYTTIHEMKIGAILGKSRLNFIISNFLSSRRNGPGKDSSNNFLPGMAERKSSRFSTTASSCLSKFNS